MDPFSVALILGAGTAAVSMAVDDHRHRRVVGLQETLGMAGADLPDSVPPQTAVPGLWQTMEIPVNSVKLMLTNIYLPRSKDEWDKTIPRAPRTNRGRSWSSSDEFLAGAPSLWDLMHKAWLGMAPKLKLVISCGVDAPGAGRALMMYGTINVSFRQIQYGVDVLEESNDNLADVWSELWAEHEEARELIGACIEDKLEEKYGDPPTISRSGIKELPNSFKAQMKQLSDEWGLFGHDVGVFVANLDAFLRSSAEFCTNKVYSEHDFQAEEDEWGAWDEEEEG